jgi:hypothetical protein
LPHPGKAMVIGIHYVSNLFTFSSFPPSARLCLCLEGNSLLSLYLQLSVIAAAAIHQCPGDVSQSPVSFELFYHS